MNKKYAFTIGIVYGIVAIVLFLIQTIVADGGIGMSSVISIFSFVAMIAIPVVYLRKLRTEQNGELIFKDALLTSFVGLLIGGLMSTIFSAIYVGLIDPAYVDRLVMMSLEMQKGFMEGAMSTEQMETAMRATEEGIREGFTPFGMLKSTAYIALFYFVVSLIIAAFMKKTNVLKPADDSQILDN